MSVKDNLKGWNLIIFQLIESKFESREFTLEDIYKYEDDFKKVYPNNFHIKDKIRQILQKLRKKELLTFVNNQGVYQLKTSVKKVYELKETFNEYVYLLSNESIPDWVKIGRTINIDKRVKELYNTSVPLPFKLEDSVEVSSLNDSRILERSIHSIIDTINPSLRKDTEASKREFFKMTVGEAKRVFELVRLINNVAITDKITVSI